MIDNVATSAADADQPNAQFVSWCEGLIVVGHTVLDRICSCETKDFAQRAFESAGDGNFVAGALLPFERSVPRQTNGRRKLWLIERRFEPTDRTCVRYRNR